MRAAPIVCPEERPLPASVYDNYAVRRFAAGGLVRRFWLGSGIWCPMGFSPASVPEGFQRTSGKPFGAPVGAYPLPRRGMTRRLRRERWGCCPEGGSTFFRSERKYQRKPAARRLQRRPTSLRTAAKPCATLVLGYALHGLRPFLALVGLRPPLVVGFGLREPNGWMPRIYSGHPIPALRPEQSDHVPWADCPQGLSSTSARCAHPPGKSPLLPIFERGSSQCRAQHG